MHVRGVAGQQDAARAVGRGLSRHVGEAGEPPWIADSIVRPVYGDESLADVPQRRSVLASNLRLHQHHADEPALALAYRMLAACILVEPELRLLRHLGLR